MIIKEEIIAWYRVNKRDLPWRDTVNPYLVWLSEIILQQTRVNQGLPYFLRFTEKFPTVFDLANAQQDDVMLLWQGLGYYSRARNLHTTAKYVAYELNGKFPNSHQGLLQLKGVGDYTAAAIASFCYNEPVPVVDGNVYRVLSRVFDIETPIDSTEGKKYFKALAQKLIDKTNPGEYNQAIMEFGAVQCTPGQPNCTLCPLQNGCVAFYKKKVNQLPKKEKKTKIKERYLHFFLITDGENFLIEKRQANDIWKNLYQLPLLETEEATLSEAEIMEKATQELAQDINTVSFQGEFKHVLSHRILKVFFWKIDVKKLQKPTNNRLLVALNDRVLYSMPRIITKFFEQKYF
jgi:A/G-specific adenine glycosylase